MFAKIGDLLETSFMADPICMKELLQFFFEETAERDPNCEIISNFCVHCAIDTVLYPFDRAPLAMKRKFLSHLPTYLAP